MLRIRISLLLEESLGPLGNSAILMPESFTPPSQPARVLGDDSSVHGNLQEQTSVFMTNRSTINNHDFIGACFAMGLNMLFGTHPGTRISHLT